jgi:hypothetical protein
VNYTDRVLINASDSCSVWNTSSIGSLLKQNLGINRITNSVISVEKVTAYNPSYVRTIYISVSTLDLGPPL